MLNIDLNSTGFAQICALDVKHQCVVQDDLHTREQEMPNVGRFLLSIETTW